MHVRKRDGTCEPVKFEKVVRRLEELSKGLRIDPNLIAKRVIYGMVDGITTMEIETLTADVTVSMSSQHPDYGLLAGRVVMRSIHKDTKGTLLSCSKGLAGNINKHGEPLPLIATSTLDVIKRHHKELQHEICYERDMTYDFFAVKTLQQVYLLKNEQGILERPQHMHMRVAVGLWGDNISRVVETYHLPVYKTVHPRQSHTLQRGHKSPCMFELLSGRNAR